LYNVDDNDLSRVITRKIIGRRVPLVVSGSIEATTSNR